MKAPIGISISFLVLLLVLQTFAQQPANTLAVGWITDTLCARKGANAQHVECAKRNVTSGKAKYALYDERAKKLHILEPQETVALYLALGQRVKVTGTLSLSPVQLAGQSFDASQKEVVTHASALDSSTSIAGILTISSVEFAPPPTRAE